MKKIYLIEYKENLYVTTNPNELIDFLNKASSGVSANVRTYDWAEIDMNNIRKDAIFLDF